MIPVFDFGGVIVDLYKTASIEAFDRLGFDIVPTSARTNKAESSNSLKTAISPRRNFTMRSGNRPTGLS